MNTIILVHGAWHGAWCWYKVIPLLKKKGLDVLMPDLPGHGRDRTPIGAISLQHYTEYICQILDAQPEPVTLVGHSLGGITITQAAEYRPDKIKLLVYLAAYLLPDGLSALQAPKEDAPPSDRPRITVLSEDQSQVMVKEEMIRDILYGDCSEEDVTLARTLLVSEPTAAFATPVHTTPHNFGRVPRTYIQCRRDRAIPAQVQEKMYTDLPCQKVIVLDTSHSPFFSAPGELAAHLISLTSTTS